MRKAAIPGLVTLVILRLPSLMEPHWYTDEAGYVNVARGLLRGKILYIIGNVEKKGSIALAKVAESIPQPVSAIWTRR